MKLFWKHPKLFIAACMVVSFFSGNGFSTHFIAELLSFSRPLKNRKELDAEQ